MNSADWFVGEVAEVLGYATGKPQGLRGKIVRLYTHPSGEAWADLQSDGHSVVSCGLWMLGRPADAPVPMSRHEFLQLDGRPLLTFTPTGKTAWGHTVGTFVCDGRPILNTAPWHEAQAIVWAHAADEARKQTGRDGVRLEIVWKEGVSP